MLRHCCNRIGCSSGAIDDRENRDEGYDELSI